MDSRLFNRDLFSPIFLTKDKINGSSNFVVVKESANDKVKVILL